MNAAKEWELRLFDEPNKAPLFPKVLFYLLPVRPSGNPVIIPRQNLTALLCARCPDGQGQQLYDQVILTLKETEQPLKIILWQNQESEPFLVEGAGRQDNTVYLLGRVPRGLFHSGAVVGVVGFEPTISASQTQRFTG